MGVVHHQVPGEFPTCGCGADFENHIFAAILFLFRNEKGIF